METLSSLLLPALLLVVGAFSSESFEWVQDKWAWLSDTYPIVRYLASGLWGGVAGWLALQIGQSVPADIAQFDVGSWGAFLVSLVTWAYHSLRKSVTASVV